MKPLVWPLVLLSLVAPSLLAASAQPPPNIVFILADDIGYGDLSCYGATKVKTPHLDSLATRGLRFTDAYAPASVCTPTRYAILTGDYAWRSSAGRAVLNGDAALCIDPEKFTLPDLLKKAGYQTACVGKWHLGFGRERADYNGDLKPGPLELGFDYFYGIPATGDRVPTVMVENHRVAGLDPADPIRIHYKKKIGDEPTGAERPDLLKLTANQQHSGTIVNGISRIGFMTGGQAARWVDEDIADVIAKKAVTFIEGSRAQPFFLFLATHDIHAPRYPHPRFMKDSQLGTRGGAIAQLDWTVGEVLAALQRLGLEENTLVIFSSDNGGATDDGYADADLTGHRYNGPLRGIKSGLWEGGNRVPFLARWPAGVKPGQTTGRIVTQLDLFATAAALTGQTLPAGAARDSLSFLPVLQGRPETHTRTEVVLQSGQANLALRDGDWKYVPDLKVVEGWYAARVKPLSGEGLFNLATDLGEQTNVAAQHPDVARRLREKLATYQVGAAPAR
jgi:arylsulfatase A-like enzyme